MRFGITGHRDLTPSTVEMINWAFDEQLSTAPRPIVGISCLAEGADQLFARAVLQHGGELEVIVPSAAYRALREDLAEYDRLLAQAHRVTRLPYPGDGPAAHMAASLVLVERSDVLIAVWDGQPARSFAGTADVVAYARQVDVLVVVLWPSGSARETAVHDRPGVL
jgi:hypothetical protein